MNILRKRITSLGKALTVLTTKRGRNERKTEKSWRKGKNNSWSPDLKLNSWRRKKTTNWVEK